MQRTVFKAKDKAKETEKKKTPRVMVNCSGYVSCVLSTEGDTPKFEFKRTEKPPRPKVNAGRETYDEEVERKAQAAERNKRPLPDREAFKVLKRLPPLFVIGYLPSYSPFVSYDLELVQTSNNTNLYLLSHIVRVKAPKKITSIALRDKVFERMSRTAFGGTFIFTHHQRNRIKVFLKSQREHSDKGKFSTIDNRTEFCSRKDIDTISSEDLKTAIKGMRLLDGMFLPQIYYQVFRFFPLRDLRKSDSDELAKKLGALRNNPIFFFLTVCISQEEMNCNRISWPAYKEITRTLRREFNNGKRVDKVQNILNGIKNAEGAIMKARQWIDKSWNKMRFYGAMRYEVPAAEELALLLENRIISLDPRPSNEKLGLLLDPDVDRKTEPLLMGPYDTRIYARFNVACDLVNDIMNVLDPLVVTDEKQRETSTTDFQFLSISGVATGVTEMKKFFVAGRTLLVTATDYTRAELVKTMNVPVHRIIPLTLATSWLWKPNYRGKYDRLILHATEQMGLETIHELMTGYHGLKYVMVVADLMRIPPSPHVGIGHFTRDLTRMGLTTIQQAESIDQKEIDKSFILKNQFATMHNKIAMMQLLPNRPLNDQPAVILQTIDEFETIVRAMGSDAKRQSFQQQILVERVVTRDHINRLLHGDKHDPRRLYSRQLIQCKGSTCVWQIMKIFDYVDGKKNYLNHSEVGKKNTFLRVLSEEDPPRLVKKLPLDQAQKIEANDVDFMNRNMRLNVHTVYYVLDGQISSAKSLYTALSMAKTNCVFVGSIRDLNAAIGKNMAFGEDAHVVVSGNRQDLPDTVQEFTKTELAEIISKQKKKKKNDKNGGAEECMEPEPEPVQLMMPGEDDDDAMAAMHFLEQQEAEENKEEKEGTENTDDDGDDDEGDNGKDEKVEWDETMMEEFMDPQEGAPSLSSILGKRNEPDPGFEGEEEEEMTGGDMSRRKMNESDE